MTESPLKREVTTYSNRVEISNMDAMFEDPSVFDIFARGKSFDYSEALKMNVEVLDWTKGGLCACSCGQFPPY